MCEMTNLKDKVVLVVGGSSGFGLAVATMAANVGARVTITGRDTSKLAKAVAGLRQMPPKWCACPGRRDRVHSGARSKFHGQPLNEGVDGVVTYNCA